MDREEFAGFTLANFDSLPEPLKQLINERSAVIWFAAAVDVTKSALYPPNVSLGGMQRACATLISNLFKEEDVVHVAQAFCDGLMESLNTWKRTDLQKEPFNDKPANQGS
jgi:hypothetical protein